MTKSSADAGCWYEFLIGCAVVVYFLVLLVGEILK